MKSFALFAILVVAVAANPLLVESDFEIPAERDIDDLEPEVAVGEHDWQLIPDGDGHMHLVDLMEQPPLEPFFNAFSDVAVRLVTRNNVASPHHIVLNNAVQLHNSPFNPNWPTRIIVHGWQNHGGSRINTLLRDAYLARGNYNVFLVDWGRGASTLYYPTAARRTEHVGHYLGLYIDFIHNVGRARLDSITIVGHSLGAHTAGIAGKRVHGRVAAIAALDPAFPWFSIRRPDERVHYTDADYVESMHTDVGRLGFNEPLGHTTFYPNWGTSQPGCFLDITGACGHNLAFEFFAESVRSLPNNFWSTRCLNYDSIRRRNCPPSGAPQVMGGEPLLRKPYGVYYLQTNSRSPFAQGFRN